MYNCFKQKNIISHRRIFLTILICLVTRLFTYKALKENSRFYQFIYNRSSENNFKKIIKLFSMNGDVRYWIVPNVK